MQLRVHRLLVSNGIARLSDDCSYRSCTQYGLRRMFKVFLIKGLWLVRTIIIVLTTARCSKQLLACTTYYTNSCYCNNYNYIGTVHRLVKGHNVTKAHQNLCVGTASQNMYSIPQCLGGQNSLIGVYLDFQSELIKGQMLQ